MLITSHNSLATFVTFYFSTFYKLLLAVLFVISSQSTFAAEPKQAPPKLALSNSNGLIMLDYEVIPVPGLESIDLHGLHYLHQLNSWLYLGIGLHAPLTHGNYGGFMALDTTIHLQKKLFGDLLVDGGVSFGGGAGSANINQSRDLSGQGGFIKKYMGLGYEFPSFSAGVNYTHFEFKESLINHSQLSVFIQTPVTFSTGSYAYPDDTPFSMQQIACDGTCPEASESILSLELNNIFQINPIGTTKSDINAVTLQYSHFLSKQYYSFLEIDVGYQGLPFYNQLVGGIGYRRAISPLVNLSGQLGVGSGGYAPSVIDTGSGLLVYPKLSIEYMMNNKLGLSLSTGYLFAPKGSSKNYTAGIAMNYHLATDENSMHESGSEKDLVFRRFRTNVFHQTTYNIKAGDVKLENLQMLSIQFDYSLNDYLYIPIQINAAYNRFAGYPGYAEILSGLGIQTKLSTTDRFQYFFQTLIGANVFGTILKPQVGFHYTLSDRVAIYGQVGKTKQIQGTTLNPNSKNYDFPTTKGEITSADTIGIGFTYRFSLLDSRRK